MYVGKELHASPWNEGYNWTKEELRNVLESSLSVSSIGKDHLLEVTLDTEHSDYANMKDIVRWAKEMGYEAEISLCREKVHVSKNKKVLPTGDAKEGKVADYDTSLERLVERLETEMDPRFSLLEQLRLYNYLKDLQLYRRLHGSF